MGCISQELKGCGTDGVNFSEQANQASVAGTKHTSSSITHGKILRIKTTVHQNKLPLKSGTCWFRVAEEAFLPEVDGFWDV